ncbi:energy transducer TonB [Methylobrevis pamukkalensis]|nr:TonB family protein [Methylobrevis pamukkalensis]
MAADAPGFGNGSGVGSGLLWGTCLLAALVVHGAVVVALTREDEVANGFVAPPAAIMIDLPPDLALPPADSVASVAAEEVEADAPEDAAAAPEPVEAEPVEETAEAQAIEIPDAAESTEITDVAPAEMAEAVPDQPDEVVATPFELTEVDPSVPAEVEVQAAAQATPEAIAEAVPEAVAEAVPETAPAETAAMEVLTVTPRVKPDPPRRVEPVRERVKVAERRQAPPKKTEAASAKPKVVASSRAQPASQAASGASVDRKAIQRSYGGRVRAAVARQAQRMKSRDKPGLAYVTFTIAANGSYSGVRISRSSGIPKVDEAVLAAVRRVGEFPPIPAEIGRSSMPVTIPVEIKR